MICIVHQSQHDGGGRDYIDQLGQIRTQIIASLTTDSRPNRHPMEKGVSCSNLNDEYQLLRLTKPN